MTHDCPAHVFPKLLFPIQTLWPISLEAHVSAAAWTFSAGWARSLVLGFDCDNMTQPRCAKINCQNCYHTADWSPLSIQTHPRNSDSLPAISRADPVCRPVGASSLRKTFKTNQWWQQWKHNSDILMSKSIYKYCIYECIYTISNYLISWCSIYSKKNML